MLLRLKFAGWFEVRCTTDPDPTDEPRGVSGYTFAVPGEPDLDRVVRFQDWKAPRSHGPRKEDRVKVVEVSLDGEVQPDHPLVGARVDLLDEPREEQRNDAINPQIGPQPGYMYIDPFHVCFTLGEEEDEIFRLAREDDLDPKDKGVTLKDVSFEGLKRRGFVSMGSVPGDTFPRVTGQPDPVTYRLRRRGLVADELSRALDAQREGRRANGAFDATDEGMRLMTQIAGLQMRYKQLLNPNAADRPTARLTARWSRRFAVNGDVTSYVDRQGILPGPPDPTVDWPIDFWFGIFDADLNVAWAEGTLDVYLQG